MSEPRQARKTSSILAMALIVRIFSSRSVSAVGIACLIRSSLSTVAGWLSKSQFVQFAIEKNSKVSELKIRSLIQNAVNELKLEKNRGPRFAHVEFVAKPNLGVSVPDFLLGILGDYLKSKSAAPGRPEPRDRLLFERLRDKYRLILDVEPWTEYSRRRPILPWEAGVAPLETR